MPGVTVKLYSVLFKFLLKRRLETLIRSSLLYSNTVHPFGVTARPDDAVASVNPTFAAADGVATKDIHIDPQTSLSIRIFLPDTALATNLSKKSSFIDADNGAYRGYSPAIDRHIRNYRKLPVILQFHGGGFVSGSCDAVANDLFCRRIAKLLDAIVIAVGYRLAPENRYPAAFEDGVKVLNWLGKQAHLADCVVGGDFRRLDIHRQQIVDGFGESMVEPWLAAHGDPSRCVLLGVSCGANIANYVAQKAVEAGKLLDPANPLLPNRETPLKYIPPTLTVVAEHDWMRDRAIAYSEELRKVNVDAPVLDYKDTVHEFATLDMLLKTPQAQACAEDIAIWVKKYTSLRGHEFSY
ncbi:carboxyesterase 16 [Actinidia rufa]|uniref:Carboxyesterase 16 n=1 Tax=Actinidia rufa TaxID=165716 RepID=A0A7J0F0S7_9ERIC|nr:carboxyesterase 16 [Actinidia rufa]